MKSAYELAMERLQQNDPEDRPVLSEEDKQGLAGIDRRYAAKIAEREVFLHQKLTAARKDRDGEAVAQIESQLINERKRLEEERDTEKDKLRKKAAE